MLDSHRVVLTVALQAVFLVAVIIVAVTMAAEEEMNTMKLNSLWSFNLDRKQTMYIDKQI